MTARHGSSRISSMGIVLMMLLALWWGFGCVAGSQEERNNEQSTQHAQQSTTDAAASQPSFDPANFHNPLDITNRYMPLKPGTTFAYDGTEDDTPTHREFVVTDQTKTILGVDTRVIRDTNWEAGSVVEATDDWFAQDDTGNVWYLGEYTTDYEDGEVVGHAASWEAGVNDAEPRIIMEAQPRVNDTYQQEGAPGVAEDMAKVLSLNESASVPYDSFDEVLLVEEWTPLQPGVTEHKYFAPGVGQIRQVMVEGGSEEELLIDISQISRLSENGHS